ncbi:MAG: citrate transporter, partial [Acetatifactor sp.]|nr:citrate transporter [Acetatifactor sp.]
YTLLSLVLLVVWSLIQGRACPQIPGADEASVQDDLPQGKAAAYRIAVYLALFLLCLLAVAHILPWQAVFFAVIIMVFVSDRQVFVKVDYSLLLTFTGFFVFVGNVGRIPAFRDFLQDMIAGREVYTSVMVSQIISNVPAALLLSGFTEDYEGLIVGTNLGGLGTLIASMASLISYKYVAKETKGYKRKYILLFTMGNIFFLAALVLMNILLGG